MTSISGLSALPTSQSGSNPCPSILQTGSNVTRRRGRLSFRIFTGVCFALSSLFLLSGCGDETKSGGTVEVDQAKAKAEQDSMKAAMEKAHQRPTGRPK